MTNSCADSSGIPGYEGIWLVEGFCFLRHASPSYSPSCCVHRSYSPLALCFLFPPYSFRHAAPLGTFRCFLLFAFRVLICVCGGSFFYGPLCPSFFLSGVICKRCDGSEAGWVLAMLIYPCSSLPQSLSYFVCFILFCIRCVLAHLF